MRRDLPSACAALLLGTAVCAVAQPSPDPADLLADRSLEELMQVEVTSAFRHPQRLSKAAGAIYVITADDIRRSGAFNIPEALRMAPGVQVARIDTTRYAVSIRGFNGQFSNKILVLIDGRSLYLPATGAIPWEIVDTDITAIERIEVVRGPAGDTWGANAVNGVINVITRDARETAGSAFEAGTGNLEPLLTRFRYGRASEKAGLRVYANGYQRRALHRGTGSSAMRGWMTGRAGFRADSTNAKGESFSLTGDIFQSGGEAEWFRDTVDAPYVVNTRGAVESVGGHLYGMWSKRHAKGSSRLHAYFDRQVASSANADASTHTADLEYQRERQVGESQTFIAGGGIRLVSTRFPAILGSALGSTAHIGLVTGFVQDDVTLVRDRLTVTAGAKYENNTLSRASVQPTVRLAWTPNARQTVWSALTRSQRNPSRFEQEIDSRGIPVSTEAGLMLLRIRGDAAVRPETVVALEAGYRAVPRKAISLDVALFSTRYHDLIGLTKPGFGFIDGRRLVTTGFANGFSARTYGGEVAATWDVAASLRCFATYSRLHTVARDGAVSARSFEDPAGRSPLNQATFRLAYTPKAPHRLDVDLYVTGKVPRPHIPAHTRLDLVYEWRIRPGVSISAVGRDLIGGPHREYITTTFAREATVRKAASVRVRWEF